MTDTTKKSKTPILCWLDLETTGLDPTEGEILEVGIILTDLELNEIGRRSKVIKHEREDIIGMMDDYVLSMHLGSGLLAEVWKSLSSQTPKMVFLGDWQKGDLMHWIKRTVGKECNSQHYTLHLAGSSVHFDQRWLQHHVPGFAKIFSHRLLDVSAYKVAFPGLLKQPEGGAAHRAIEDVEYSIDQHRQMRTILGGQVGQPSEV